MRKGLDMSTWAVIIGEHNEKKGFVFKDRKREFWQLIALMHSEISELAEEMYEHGEFTEQGEIELADLIIRALDVAYRWDIDIEARIIEKMKKNKERPQKHGKKGVD
jgi:NTP pyrophosphatase (non-canonical NTP hydrolase)